MSSFRRTKVGVDFLVHEAGENLEKVSREALLDTWYVALYASDALVQFAD